MIGCQRCCTQTHCSFMGSDFIKSCNEPINTGNYFWRDENDAVCLAEERLVPVYLEKRRDPESSWEICDHISNIVLLTYPTASFAFYALGDINQYLSYDRLKVITPIDEKYNFHPRVQGRLINKTNKQVYVSVHLYFCDIFNQRHNQASLNISMRPEEKVEFDKYLKGSEWERTRTAHHVEFEIVKLIVDGRSITK